MMWGESWQCILKAVKLITVFVRGYITAAKVRNVAAWWGNLPEF